MRKLILLLLMCTSAAFAQTETVKFTAKIANRNSDTLVINGPNKFQRIITYKDGAFTDSFTVTPGMHQLYDGTEMTMLYLNNGYDLALAMDASQFDESIVYTGKGAGENNFLAQKALSDEQFEMQTASLKDVAAFDTALEARNKNLTSKLDTGKYDAGFKAIASQMTAMEAKQMNMFFKQAQIINKLAGAASPQFEYENHKGGKSKLSDYKGKYVYIDNWATWCGPCRAEIPSLKKIEEKYHGKNIEFVSISIDEKKDHEKWKTFVTDKQLGGVQLFADNAWNSQFMIDYAITSIPRFILIGPDGKIVDANAKRPSDPLLQAQLDVLLK